MSEYLYTQIYHNILEILAQNGETRAVTLLKLTSEKNNNITVREPLVIEYEVSKIGQKFSFLIGYVGPYQIDWGDGMVNNREDHIYDKLGVYRIKLYKNDKHEIVVRPTNDKGIGGIINFITIGRIGITTLRFMFEKSDFNGIISPNWDTTKITDISCMFREARQFNRKFGLNWETRNVVNMSGMFAFALKFNQKFGQNWDTSSVTDMSYLLSRAASFNSPFGLTLGTWDTHKVISMHGMFYYAVNFNQPFNPYSDRLDTPNLKDMGYMFSHAERFNQTFGFYYTRDGGRVWDTSKVTNMSGMFDKATEFNQPFGICDGDIWDTSSVTDMSCMFRVAENFNQIVGFVYNGNVVKTWNTANVTDMTCMFSHAYRFNQPLIFNEKVWDTGKVRDMSEMFCSAHDFNQPLFSKRGTCWDTRSVNSMNNMFENAKSFNQPVNFSLTNMENGWHINENVGMAYIFCGADSFRSQVKFLQSITSGRTTEVIKGIFSIDDGAYICINLSDYSMLYHVPDTYEIPDNMINITGIFDIIPDYPYLPKWYPR